MKKLKQILFFVIILSLSIVIFPVKQNINNYANAEIELIKDQNTILQYVSLSSRGQQINNYDFITTYKESTYSTKRYVYIYLNDTATISLKPFDIKYGFENNEDIENNFYIKSTKISISKNSDEYISYLEEAESSYASLPFKYTINGVEKEYFFAIQTIEEIIDGNSEIVDQYVKIYTAKPASINSYSITASNVTDTIKFEETETEISLEIIESLTVKNFDSNLSVNLNFSLLNINGNPTTEFEVNLKKIPARFASKEQPIVKFDLYKNLNPETMNYDYTDSGFWLQKEQTFSKVTLSFLTNQYKYTKDNPLYFILNYNGFTYKLILYSENGCLYANYTDEVKYNKAKTESEKEKAVYNLATTSNFIFNDNEQFSLSFTHRGRYNFEVYDDTYLKKLTNSNYYSTSFYIKDDSASRENYIEQAKLNEDFMNYFAKLNPEYVPIEISKKYNNFYNDFIKAPTNANVVNQINKAAKIQVATEIQDFIDQFTIKYPDTTADELNDLHILFYEEVMSNPNEYSDLINKINTLLNKKSTIFYINIAKENESFMNAFLTKYPYLTNENIEEKYSVFYDFFMSIENYSSFDEFAVAFLSYYPDVSNALIEEFFGYFYEYREAQVNTPDEEGEIENEGTDEDSTETEEIIEGFFPSKKYVSIINSIDYETKTSLLFSNIYILAQTITDQNKEIEYIVNNATLNNNVKVTIKNLSNLDIDGITLSDVITKIDVIYTEFGTSNNEHETIHYYISSIFENLSANNNDFSLRFSSDGYYQVIVYDRKGETAIEYDFTIVKKSKVTYTINGKTYQASQRFTEQQINSNITTSYINSSDPIKFSVAHNGTESLSESMLNITYVNKYKIVLGIQEVAISFSKNEDETVLYITCKGVGNSEYTIRVNDTEKTGTFYGETTIAMEEYGTYSIYMIDSMGTTGNSGFKFSKKMNTSSLILIGLSAFMIAVIALFVLKVRGRVKTR